MSNVLPSIYLQSLFVRVREMFIYLYLGLLSYETNKHDVSRFICQKTSMINEPVILVK